MGEPSKKPPLLSLVEPLEPDDAELSRRLLAADPRAFSLLFERYKELIFRVVRRQVDRDADALDLVQRVFLSAWEAHQGWLAKLRGPPPLKAYLLRIAVNAAKNFRRDQSRWRLSPVEAAEGHGEAAPDQTSVMAERQRKDALSAAVEALPKRQREVLSLRVDGGLSFREVGLALGISETNAKSNYHHAVTRLRGVFADPDDETSGGER